jgi:glycosyltransferase involved in cell wall biosynthesis
MSKILFDCTQETMYPLAKEGFSGGSQTYVKAIIKGLAARGHDVHVIAPDLEIDEQRGPNEHWWPQAYYPHQADVAVMQMHAVGDPQYDAPICVLMTSCVDPYLGPNHAWAGSFDAIPVFSQVHKDLLCKLRPVAPEKVHITGLGVDLADYDVPLAGVNTDSIPYTFDLAEARRQQRDPYGPLKTPGRMLYANDPARGLFYTLDVFDKVKEQVPEATLHVTYDFDKQLSWRAWEHSQMAQFLWDCKRRIESTPGMVNLGGLTREGIIREQLGCQVHCMPSDPPGIGTQTHGITQMECAAAGCALVLSDIEAFPEVFGAGAAILPVIGKYEPTLERRIAAADYAEVVVGLMRDPEQWAEASRKARALAEQNTWSIVVDKWERMLEGLKGEQVG